MDKYITKDALLIQTHYTDFKAFERIIYDDSYNIIKKAKKYFEDIILVCADIPENAFIEDFARKNNIDCFFGDLMDVSDRFYNCMEQFHIHFGARILIYYFLVDFNFLKYCLKLLKENQADYVMLPYNFDIKFGADVFSIQFLKKFKEVIDKERLENGDSYKFCPWALAQTHPEYFKLTYCHDVPIYDMEKLQAVRKIMNNIYPENTPLADSPLGAYRKAVSAIDKYANDVLDIACGWGDGTRYLASQYPNVIGADYSKEQIEMNLASNIKGEVTFICGDAMNENLFDENCFDAVISIHTMEHVPDDTIFLKNINKWLRPGGEFVLEVPVLMEYPFKGIDLPLSEIHKREYKIEELVTFCGSYFDVEEIYGVNRGLYVDKKMTRNALWLKLRSKKIGLGVI
jgi:SAM-dependent methyltransferase